MCRGPHSIEREENNARVERMSILDVSVVHEIRIERFEGWKGWVRVFQAME
jgi:hypothetical protein